MNFFANKLKTIASKAMSDGLQKLYRGTTVEGVIDMEKKTFGGKVTEDFVQRSGSVVVFIATVGGLYISLTNKEKTSLLIQQEENEIFIDKLQQQLSTCLASEKRCFGSHLWRKILEKP